MRFYADVYSSPCSPKHIKKSKSEQKKGVKRKKKVKLLSRESFDTIILSVYFTLRST